MKQTYLTNFTIRIPVFKAGKKTDKHLDFHINKKMKYVDVVYALEKELAATAGIPNIQPKELTSFIDLYGVWDELMVEVIRGPQTTTVVPFSDGILEYMDHLKRSTNNLIKDVVMPQEEMVKGILKTEETRSGSISARLSLLGDKGKICIAQSITDGE